MFGDVLKTREFLRDELLPRRNYDIAKNVPQEDRKRQRLVVIDV